MPSGATIRVQQGSLLFDRDPVEELLKSADELGWELSAMLPEVQLTDLLVNVLCGG